MFVNSSVETFRFSEIGSTAKGRSAVQAAGSVAPQEVFGERPVMSVQARPIAAPREKPVPGEFPAEGLSKEKAERLAKELEEEINSKKGTQVEFRVSEGEYTFNFAVVEKETGEIVREFPPKELMVMAKRARESLAHGVMVDESV